MFSVIELKLTEFYSFTIVETGDPKQIIPPKRVILYVNRTTAHSDQKCTCSVAISSVHAVYTVSTLLGCLGISMHRHGNACLSLIDWMKPKSHGSVLAV